MLLLKNNMKIFIILIVNALLLFIWIALITGQYQYTPTEWCELNFETYLNVYGIEKCDFSKPIVEFNN